MEVYRYTPLRYGTLTGDRFGLCLFEAFCCTVQETEEFFVLLYQSEPATSTPEPASPTPQVTPRDSDSDDDDNKKNPEYARLITIRQAKPVKGTSMKDRLKVEEAVKRISLAESKLKDVAEEFPDLLVK